MENLRSRTCFLCLSVTKYKQTSKKHEMWPTIPVKDHLASFLEERGIIYDKGNSYVHKVCNKPSVYVKHFKAEGGGLTPSPSPQRAAPVVDMGEGDRQDAHHHHGSNTAGGFGASLAGGTEAARLPTAPPTSVVPAPPSTSAPLLSPPPGLPPRPRQCRHLDPKILLMKHHGSVNAAINEIGALDGPFSAEIVPGCLSSRGGNGGIVDDEPDVREVRKALMNKVLYLLVKDGMFGGRLDLKGGAFHLPVVARTGKVIRTVEFQNLRAPGVRSPSADTSSRRTNMAAKVVSKMMTTKPDKVAQKASVVSQKRLLAAADPTGEKKMSVDKALALKESMNLSERAWDRQRRILQGKGILLLPSSSQLAPLLKELRKKGSDYIDEKIQLKAGPKAKSDKVETYLTYHPCIEKLVGEDVAELDKLDEFVIHDYQEMTAEYYVWTFGMDSGQGSNKLLGVNNHQVEANSGAKQKVVGVVELGGAPDTYDNTKIAFKEKVFPQIEKVQDYSLIRCMETATGKCAASLLPLHEGAVPLNNMKSIFVAGEDLVALLRRKYLHCSPASKGSSRDNSKEYAYVTVCSVDVRTNQISLLGCLYLELLQVAAHRRLPTSVWGRIAALSAAKWMGVLRLCDNEEGHVWVGQGLKAKLLEFSPFYGADTIWLELHPRTGLEVRFSTTERDLRKLASAGVVQHKPEQVVSVTRMRCNFSTDNKCINECMGLDTNFSYGCYRCPCCYITRAQLKQPYDNVKDEVAARTWESTARDLAANNDYYENAEADGNGKVADCPENLNKNVIREPLFYWDRQNISPATLHCFTGTFQKLFDVLQKIANQTDGRLGLVVDDREADRIAAAEAVDDAHNVVKI